MMGGFEGFFWGIAGGVLAELLGFFRLRNQLPEEWPICLVRWQYWAITTTMILAGGFLVVAYIRSAVAVNAIMAINLGASAPLLIGSFVGQAPPISPGKID